MATAPTRPALAAYLGEDHSWTPTELDAALAAETAAQARAVRVPAGDGPYPADLAEALFRRVAHNLALRALPLGVQSAIVTGAVATNRVGGTDAEVRRLEAPYRRRLGPG